MRTLLTALALAPLTLGLAACGSEEEPEGGGGGPPVTVEQGQPVEVKGSEYAFEPADVVVQGAGPIKITLENVGSLAHNLRVMKGGEDLGGTPTFTGGQTRSSTVDLRAGEYEMICTVGDHAQLGMTGTLTVR